MDSTPHMLWELYAKILYFSERNIARQTEAGTEHLLLGADQSDIVNGKLDILVTTASNAIINGNLVSNALRDSLANVNVIIDFVIRMSRETIDMDHGEFLTRRRGEQLFFSCVQPRERIEELDRCSRQVHNIVIDNVGAGICLGWWRC